MLDSLKAVVRKFNRDVIERGDRSAFDSLIASNFVNRTAPAGAHAGPESMWNTFHDVLRPALSELSVTIHDQIAEGEKVTTRKTITGIHTGTLFGIEQTGKRIHIEVIDIVRISGGAICRALGSE